MVETVARLGGGSSLSPPQVLLYCPIFHEKLEMGNFVCGNPPIFSSCSLCGTQQPLVGAESGHRPPFGGL